MQILLQVGWQLVWLTGWLLGVIGFFSARSAHAELRRLRAGLPSQAAPSAPAPEPASPAVLPPPLPLPRAAPSEPVPESTIRRQPSQPPPEAPPPGPSSRDLETLLTTNWGVWLGSAALLLAGVFLLRYAVEQELLGPAARCGLAALLGVALLLLAEWLHRGAGPPLTGPALIDQAPAGLAAGGTGVLFGAAYGAGPFFALLSPPVAFAAMAAASLTALAAALRYGPLTAATGIAGAFATPALVATQSPSLPGLFVYLFIVSIAALLVVRRTAWTWLAWAATIAGALWVAYAGIQATPDRWAAAAFVPAAAMLNLLLLPAAALDHPVLRRLAWMPFATLGAAGVLLDIFAPAPAVRTALFLLSPIAIGKATGEPRLNRLPWIAALFGLLTLLLWTPVTPASIVPALLRHATTPGSALPLAAAAILFAAIHAAAGLWLQRRTPDHRPWAALVAGVPVLTLAATYARISAAQPAVVWAAMAVALAAALTATTGAAIRHIDRQTAGIHAAGAVAALALGCAILLHTYWLTLAIALFLPPLAWIEARADLPPLRRVARAVAIVVIVRLLLNWYGLQDVFGTAPFLNGLAAAYAAPAVSFAVAAALFRRRGDDRLVAILEAGAVTFLALFIGLALHHAGTAGQLARPVSFTEAALHLLTIALQATAYLYLARQMRRVVLGWAWRIFGAGALAISAGLLALNPLVTNAAAGAVALFAAYLAPAGLAVLARRAANLRTTLGAYAAIAGFAWITLQIRQLFHPGSLGLQSAPIDAAELWCWSGGWLAYGIGLMAAGIRTGQRLLRITALCVIGLVCIKVFAIDMANLTGLWRVLSFLGLGLALIGLGVAYRRFVLSTGQQSTG